MCVGEHGPTQEGGPPRQARAQDGMHATTASMAPGKGAARGARKGHQTTHMYVGEHGPTQKGGPPRQARAQDTMNEDKRAWPQARERPAAPGKGTRRHA